MISSPLESKERRVLLPDQAFAQEPGLERGKVGQEDSGREVSGQSPGWRAEKLPPALELLGKLPCGSEYSSDHLTLLHDGLL
jgi:hypothetical protein